MNRRAFFKALAATAAQIGWKAVLMWALPWPAALAAGNENRHAADTDDGLARLIAFQRAIIRKDRTTPVWQVFDADPERAGHRLMEALSPRLNPGLPVLIKPNIGGFSGFKTGADNGLVGRITDIRFVEGIVRYLAEHGVRRMTIAEGWGKADPPMMQRLFDEAGYRDLADRHPGVSLVDLNHYGGDGKHDALSRPVVLTHAGSQALPPGLVAPKIYIDHLIGGLVINVAKLKMHRFAVLTAGMKNLIGVIGFDDDALPHTRKWRIHGELHEWYVQRRKSPSAETTPSYRAILETFSQRLCDVYALLRPHLTLIDGVLATGGDGFERVVSVPLCTAIGSENTFFADCVAASMAGYDHNPDLACALGIDAPPYLDIASRRFYQIPRDRLRIRKETIGQPPTAGGSLDFDTLPGARIQGDALTRLSGGDTIHACYLGHDLPDIDRYIDDMPPDELVWIPHDWKGAPLPPGIATGLRCGYTDTALVIGLIAHCREVRSDDTATNQTGDTPALFQADAFEMFLTPTPDASPRYLEFGMNPAGNRLDLNVDSKPHRYNTAWDSGMRVKSRIDERAKIWRGAMVIPFAAIGRPGKHATWRVNFFRTEGTGPNRLFMAWRPTGTKTPNFHVPEAFGRLRFAI